MAASKLLLVAALAILLCRCALADDPDEPTTLRDTSTLAGAGGHSGDAAPQEGSPPWPSTGASSGVPTPGVPAVQHAGAAPGDSVVVESILANTSLAGSAADQWSSSGAGEAVSSPPGAADSYSGEESGSSDEESGSSDEESDSSDESDYSGGSYGDDGDDTVYDLLRLFGV
ncbi:uncharacterized protein LOC134535672 isoform X2 [Bacillus rossius redtenbacheri]|uniref:uncharacterized protein LOC134535672 isoform X2 n=1 Tax=Bacillus rossius redtenbacheri TaxID=93214 RepID=UPI002FDDE664